MWSILIDFLHLHCIGQEDSKVDIEDGIRFTPFNLKEEYEEGEFDADGMFLFKKNKVLTVLLMKWSLLLKLSDLVLQNLLVVQL